MHLTNYTVNKKSSKFAQNQGAYGMDPLDSAAEALAAAAAASGMDKTSPVCVRGGGGEKGI
jgi:hypothetical protein